MRIHNTVTVQNSKRRWPVPAAFAVLLLLTGVNFFSAGDHSAGALSTAVQQKVTQVIIAKQLIPAGKIIDRSDIAIGERTEAELPEGVLSDTADVIGKAATSPIPARAPIAAIWIADDDEIGQVPLGSLGALLTPPPQADQVPAVASAPEAQSAHLFLKVRGELPPVGSRVAIGIEGKKGKSAVVLAESVVESTSGRQIQLRVTEDEKNYLKAAQLLGKVRLISLGADADENPFRGIVVSDLAQLKVRLNGAEHRDISTGNGAGKS